MTSLRKPYPIAQTKLIYSIGFNSQTSKNFFFPLNRTKSATFDANLSNRNPHPLRAFNQNPFSIAEWTDHHPIFSRSKVFIHLNPPLLDFQQYGLGRILFPIAESVCLLM